MNRGSSHKREGPRESVRGPKSRSYDYIALHLLSSWLACLRCGSSNPYIGFRVLSDDPLAYSAKSIPAEREGKTTNKIGTPLPEAHQPREVAVIHPDARSTYSVNPYPASHILMCWNRGKAAFRSGLAPQKQAP